MSIAKRISDFEIDNGKACRNESACGHWAWRDGSERRDTCPFRCPDAIPIAVNDNIGDMIFVPSDAGLAERLTMYRLALAFRSFLARATPSDIGAIIGAIFRRANALVIDNDGVVIDLQRTATSAIFQKAFDQGWIDAFFAGKAGVPDRLAIQRIKLIWIALALCDRQCALEILG
jgi:hypothetical protein